MTTLNFWSIFESISGNRTKRERDGDMWFFCLYPSVWSWYSFTQRDSCSLYCPAPICRYVTFLAVCHIVTTARLQQYSFLMLWPFLLWWWEICLSWNVTISILRLHGIFLAKLARANLRAHFSRGLRCVTLLWACSTSETVIGRCLGSGLDPVSNCKSLRLSF